MTDTTAGPLYQRLADRLAGDIRSGAIPVGARLQTQRELAAEIGTTIGTVARAYDLLYERGLVTREVGRGTFVEAAPVANTPDRAAILDKIDLLERELAQLRALVEKL